MVLTMLNYLQDNLLNQKVTPSRPERFEYYLHHTKTN
jgi:hypothetical protein